jgi:alginate O-acetyltransferase complex protein AlgI
MNLLIVFFLVGLWHGANWTFVVWGLYNGFFLILERTSANKILTKLWPPLQHIYALFVIMSGFVIFFSPTVSYAGIFIKKMLLLEGFQSSTGEDLSMYMDKEIIIALSLGCFFSINSYLQIEKALKDTLQNSNNKSQIILRDGILPCIRLMWYASILLLSCMALASKTYNPFIYFKF